MIPTDTIAKLTRGLNNLSEKDRGFARDLIRSVEGRGFSTEKQTYWLELLAKRSAGEAETKTEAVGDLAAIYVLFNTAAEHLKHPKIVLGYNRAGRTSELTIYVAGERSSTPGVLQVKDGDTWFGRVHQNGNFEHSRRDPPPPAVTDALMRFAIDPAGEAAKHGHLTGKCCFCNRALTDERSTAVGYGQTCAAHFGLPWGAKAAKAAAEQPALALEAPMPTTTPAPRAWPYCVSADDVMDALRLANDYHRPLIEAAIATAAIRFGMGLDLSPTASPTTRANFLQHMLRWAENQPDISMAPREQDPDEGDGPDPEDEAERRALARAYATI